MTFLGKALVLLVASLKREGNAYASEADAGNETTSAHAGYREEFFDPIFWHPKSRNFEIIDWEKFEKKCIDTIPFVYDPPQGPIDDIFRDPFALWGRLENLSDEDLATAAEPLPGMASGKVSDPGMEVFSAILGRSPNPDLIPEPLRNKLFWMDENHITEYLINFNRAAWRKNTPEGRVIGLINKAQDKAVANTKYMVHGTTLLKDQFASFQMSPSGKFLKIFWTPKNASDPAVDGDWIDMYVVQEGDVFTDTDGDAVDFVQPGDIYRLTTLGRKDPYDCYGTLQFSYFMRPVAVIDGETGVISPGRDYDAYIERVTAEPPEILRESSANFTNSTGWTKAKKFEFLNTYLPDKMMYWPSPQAPPAELLDNIGKDEHVDDSTEGSDQPGDAENDGSDEPGGGSSGAVVASSLAMLLVAAASLFL